MAKTSFGTNTKKETKRVKRRGVVAKTKNGRNKNSKNYKKKYRGQGR
jgi:hypothetical protein